MTLELFFLVFDSVSSFEGLGPQLINFDDLIISGDFMGEASTFSLSLSNRFLIPLFFIILAISSSCFCFFLISSSICPDCFFLLLLARFETKELSKELQMFPKDWLRPESFFLMEREESE
jgi:hypothetical protein